jgi:hypothetical protein
MVRRAAASCGKALVIMAASMILLLRLRRLGL